MIPTFTGKCVNPFDLKPGDICIEDIAHHLALVNRFNGATKWPINVAQHSVYVARLCEGSEFPPRGNPVALQALLHDASEAYICDINTFLKRKEIFRAYRRLEYQLQSEIYKHFNCDTVERAMIRVADNLMARFEARMAFGKDFYFCGRKGEYPSLTEKEMECVGVWNPWPWEEAEEIFLTEFKRFSDDH